LVVMDQLRDTTGPRGGLAGAVESRPVRLSRAPPCTAPGGTGGCNWPPTMPARAGPGSCGVPRPPPG